MVQCQFESPPILSSPKRLEPDSNGLVGALVEGERARSLGYNIAVGTGQGRTTFMSTYNTHVRDHDS